MTNLKWNFYVYLTVCKKVRLIGVQTNGKTIFQYDGNERVNKKTHYIRNETEIAINQFYEYNKEGNIIKESLNDFRTGEKKSTEFQYKYEYY